MQACDSTCAWCARNFWAWLQKNLRGGDRASGRSGAGSRNAAAATSIHAR